MSNSREEIPNFNFTSDLRETFERLNRFGFGQVAFHDAHLHGGYSWLPPTPNPPPTENPWSRVVKEEGSLVRTRYRVIKVILEPLPDTAEPSVEGANGFQLLPEYTGPGDGDKVPNVFVLNGVRYTQGLPGALSPKDPCILPHQIQIDGKTYNRMSG